MKTCTKCEVEKELKDFSKNKRNKDGLQEQCKECGKLYYRKNRKSILTKAKVRRDSTHIDNISASKKKYYKENKSIILEAQKIYVKGRKVKTIENQRLWRLNNKLIIQTKQKAFRENSDLPYNRYKGLITPDLKVRVVKGKIQVACYNCGTFLKPSLLTLRNHFLVNGEKSNIYCSKTCKKACPVFAQKKWPKGFKPDTRELQGPWAKAVKERDGYKCQKCGSKENLHAHHVEPLHITYDAWLVENGITFCAVCHFGYAHKLPGCSVKELRESCSS
jgi:hypothetical protein